MQSDSKSDCILGGELGIRTPGTLLYTTFRESHLRPLGQLSRSNYFYQFLAQMQENRARKNEFSKFEPFEKLEIQGFLTDEMTTSIHLQIKCHSQYDCGIYCIKSNLFIQQISACVHNTVESIRDTNIANICLPLIFLLFYTNLDKSTIFSCKNSQIIINN